MIGRVGMDGWRLATESVASANVSQAVSARKTPGLFVGAPTQSLSAGERAGVRGRVTPVPIRELTDFGARADVVYQVVPAASLK